MSPFTFASMFPSLGKPPAAGTGQERRARPEWLRTQLILAAREKRRRKARLLTGRHMDSQFNRPFTPRPSHR